MTMGDRLVVLNEGELQQIGTPLEFFYRPENLFVASFIGSPSMNSSKPNATGERSPRTSSTTTSPRTSRRPPRATSA